MKIALAALLALTPIAAVAGEYDPGGYREDVCYRYEYREEYVPGTRHNPGYVKSYEDKVEVPCGGSVGFRPARPMPDSADNIDNNSCVEGTVAGGLLGGGLGAALSRKEGRYWAIPLGIVTGAMVGCDIDGG